MYVCYTTMCMTIQVGSYFVNYITSSDCTVLYAYIPLQFECYMSVIMLSWDQMCTGSMAHQIPRQSYEQRCNPLAPDVQLSDSPPELC